MKPELIIWNRLRALPTTLAVANDLVREADRRAKPCVQNWTMTTYESVNYCLEW